MSYKTILQTDLDVCFVCGKRGATDWHHVFNGAMKKRSEEDGMMIHIHRGCHRFLHEHPMSNETMKKRAQRKWEETYGDREAFIERYRKNYLWKENK